MNGLTTTTTTTTSATETAALALNEAPTPSTAAASAHEETLGQVKRDIIDHYDQIQSQIDVRTETLLMHLPEALRSARDELLERVADERDKNLAALDADSPLQRHKAECHQRFVQLRDEYNSCSASGNAGDLAKREDIQRRLDELKRDVQLLEEFLDEFKNRTLCFEEADRSVYASLIGELVTSSEFEDAVEADTDAATSAIDQN